jgi:hypothetical protein
MTTSSSDSHRVLEIVQAPSPNAQTVVLVLKGVVSELSAPVFERAGAALSDLGGKTIVLNMEDVSSLNSIGIKTWMRFLQHIDPQSPLVFERCSIAVVELFSLVHGFVGRAQVKSFAARYVCESCGELKLEMIERASIPAGTIPNPPACQTCGATKVLDGLEDEYFLFLETN